MGHFGAAMLEVRDLELAIAMLAFIRGLPVGGFYHSLFKRFLQDLLELLSCFEKYVNSEEGMVVKRKEKGERKCP